MVSWGAPVDIVLSCCVYGFVEMKLLGASMKAVVRSISLRVPSQSRGQFSSRTDHITLRAKVSVREAQISYFEFMRTQNGV